MLQTPVHCEDTDRYYTPPALFVLHRSVRARSTPDLKHTERLGQGKEESFRRPRTISALFLDRI